MTSAKKKPLHLANDFASLKLRCDKDLQKFASKQSASVLKRALLSLMLKADKQYNDGDEEMAYIFYMRFAELAIGTKDVNRELLNRAIGRCEELKNSLEKRYLEKPLDALPSPPAVDLPKPNLANGSVHTLLAPKSTPIPPPASSGPGKPIEVAPSPPSSGPARRSANGLLNDGANSKVTNNATSGQHTVPGQDSDSVIDSLPQSINGPHTEQRGPHFVSSADLRELLVQGKVLVLDCRSEEAFKDSRISISSNVINIPKSYMGITSFSIAEQLTGSEKELYTRRKEFEKVVIVDWDGQGYASPNAPAACVFESMWKWTNPGDGIMCYHLKDGYRFWVAAYPHDTTNSKPREELNKVTHVPEAIRVGLPTSGSLSSRSGGLNVAGRESVPSAEQLRDLTWLPQSFETKVQVVQTPTVAPTVGPSGQTPSSYPQSTSTTSHQTISSSPGKTLSGGGDSVKVVSSKPVPPAPPVSDVGSGDLRRDGQASSELSRVDRSSQDTVKQFAQSVNEKISTGSGPKVRTRSEASDSSPIPAHTTSSYGKPQLLRSRSLGDIYEEPNRLELNRLPDDGGAQYLGGQANQTNNVDHLPHLVNKRPSIDRSLKPSNSLDAATVHRPKDGQSTHPTIGTSQTNNNASAIFNGGVYNNRAPIGSINFNNNNNNNSPNFNAINNNEVNQRSLVGLPTRPSAKPSLPPKTRRSQSPVQVCRFGPTERTSGLRNLGNSCYMNSVLQALAHSTEFAKYFVSRQHETHLNRSNPRGSGGVLPKVFSQLLSQLWCQNETREALVPFRSLMGSMYPMYSTYEQQDSHEFLVNLLDRLHEDLNRAELRNRPNSSSNSDTVVTFKMLATELNKFFTAHNDMQLSVVTQNYEGILVSGLKCHTCQNDSYTFQVFNVLSVPIPPINPVEIFNCFDEFFREEKVEDWQCPHCKAKRTASKHMRIARLPKHLIIHLVRFKNESWTAFSFSSYKKITNVVQFSVDLDTRELAQYVYSKEVKLKSYTLYAIVNHYGTISSGHYYSDCRFLPGTQWYRYSDQQVTTLQSKDPDVGSAYMLFYSCVD